MLSKEEKKQINSEFWDQFKSEMRSVKSSTGKSISWISYPSDVKDVYIRMETDTNGGRFCFDIQPKDDGIRSILYEQMTELKRVMETEMGEADGWNEFDRVMNNRKVSRIFWKSDPLNFYKKEDQSEIKAFFREKLLAFDRFYQEYKDILIALAD